RPARRARRNRSAGIQVPIPLVGATCSTSLIPAGPETGRRKAGLPTWNHGRQPGSTARCAELLPLYLIAGCCAFFSERGVSVRFSLEKPLSGERQASAC